MFTIRTAAETLGLGEKWVRYHVQKRGLGNWVGGVIILLKPDLEVLESIAPRKAA